MKTMNMNDVMSNKDYTMIMDGTAPLGMAKFRYEPTQEIVYVIVNEKLAQANNTNKEETIINTNTNVTNDNVVVENNKDNTTTQNTQQATNNNAQKGKKMAFGERWMKAIRKGQEAGYKAAKKTGYGIGYATTTIKEEVAYAVQKVASTKTAQSFVSGYYDGKADADYAFIQRVRRREEKARERADAKAAMEAAQELFDEFEDEDFDFE